MSSEPDWRDVVLNILGDRPDSIVRQVFVTATVVILLPIAACHNQGATSIEAGPRTFASPQDAGKALADAARSQNQEEVRRIFGSGAVDLVSTGDAVQDKDSLNAFAQAYDAMNRWRNLTDDAEILLVGTDNQAFPIPIMRNESGKWHFDAAAGKDELLALRIGRNEIATILTCAAIADAQSDYFSQKHGGVKQYARKFISDPGQQNGLYWDSPQGSSRSPLGPLVAYATAEGYKLQPDKHKPFNGYYFAILLKQGADAQGGVKNYVVDGKLTGGFAAVAYPSKYGDSGIMTFLIDQNGAAYQKDLGKATGEIASAITEFNPDKTWNAVQ